MLLMSLGASMVAEVDAKKLRDGEIDFAVINGNKKCFAYSIYIKDACDSVFKQRDK